jgi:hypothetical protein
MITAICHLTRFAALKVRLALTNDQAKAFRLLCDFERRCK